MAGRGSACRVLGLPDSMSGGLGWFRAGVLPPGDCLWLLSYWMVEERPQKKKKNGGGEKER